MKEKAQYRKDEYVHNLALAVVYLAESQYVQEMANDDWRGECLDEQQKELDRLDPAGKFDHELFWERTGLYTTGSVKLDSDQ